MRFNIALQSSEVPESAVNAVLVISPLDAIPGPSDLTLLVSTAPGTAAGTRHLFSYSNAIINCAGLFPHIATMDFTPLSAVQVTFPVGASGPMTVNIPIIDDNFVEGRETFSVAVTSGDPRALFSGSPATVAIIDDDRKLKLIFTIYIKLCNLRPHCLVV